MEGSAFCHGQRADLRIFMKIFLDRDSRLTSPANSLPFSRIHRDAKKMAWQALVHKRRGDCTPIWDREMYKER
jgi:hypothetical protein